jgi:hypothetical protein
MVILTSLKILYLFLYQKYIIHWLEIPFISGLEVRYILDLGLGLYSGWQTKLHSYIKGCKSLIFLDFSARVVRQPTVAIISA